MEHSKQIAAPARPMFAAIDIAMPYKAYGPDT
jgi:hypothetical protein